MNKILYLSVILFSGTVFSQNCTQVVPPEAVVQGVGTYHITSDVTITNSDGSVFYVCSGAHLTIEASSGNDYLLEDGAELTIMNHDGNDNVIAKGNAIITDYSVESIVVSAESTVTVSKPNAPNQYVFLTCPLVTFDYQMVGGSTPCAISSTQENTREVLKLYPNPNIPNGLLNFDSPIKSIQIFNLDGTLVYLNENVTESSIQLPETEKGMFLVKITLPNNVKLSERIIIE